MYSKEMSGEEWKKMVYDTAYAYCFRLNFGHKCDLRRKTLETINEATKKFLRVYPHSRRYETRRYNRENNIKDGTFLDTIKNDITRRAIYYAMLCDFLGEEAPLKGTGNILVDVVRPLAEIRRDKSKGYNATLRLVYGKMPVCWKNRMTRTGKNKKSEIILADKHLMKLFRETIRKMLDEINA